MIALGALVSLALSSSSVARVDDEGFGGAPIVDADVAPEKDERLRSAAERSATTPPASSRPPAARGARSPIGDAIDAARTTRTEGPLTALRDEVRALDDETARAEVAVKNGTLDEETRDAVVLRWRERRLVLDDVELYALRLRERCMRARGELEALPELLPRGARLSVDAPGVALLLRTPDAKECDRRALVDDEAIARVARLHAIEREVTTMGYHQLTARRALEEEREEILFELNGKHDDKLRTLKATTKRYDARSAQDALKPRGTLRDLVGEDPAPVTPIR